MPKISEVEELYRYYTMTVQGKGLKVSLAKVKRIL